MSRRPAAASVFVMVGVLLIALALVANEWVLEATLTVGGRITSPAARLLLALIDLALVSAGTTFIVRRRRTPWREMLLSIVATLFALVLVEGGLRVVFAIRNRLSPPDRVMATGIGWEPVANLSLDSDVPGFGRVHYTTTRGGFRMFGDPKTTKPKILVLGDSFTEAATVSDGEPFYARLAAARPDWEIFAIGAGGYGTLQELMLLDAWVDTVKPDLVLLQIHPNDLINNDEALEAQSTSNNNQMTRPYWQGGRVVEQFPENVTWGPVYNLIRHSYLLRLLNIQLNFLRTRSLTSIENSLTQATPEVIAATNTTIELLSRMRSRAGVPVVAFSVKPEGYYGFWSRAETCRRAGVLFIPGVGEAVDAAAAAGQKVTGLPIDAHWNARGHQIAAGVIEAWLEKNGLPKSHSE